MKKSILRTIIGIVFVNLAVSGCSGKIGGESEKAYTNAGIRNEEETDTGTKLDAERERTLIWGVPSTPDGLDVDFHVSNIVTEVYRNYSDFLFQYPNMLDESGFLVKDFNAEPEPYLAEYCELSDDKRTITIKLREGIMSHAGNELTAEDAVYKWENAFNTQGQTWTFVAKNQGITDVESQVRIIDKYTYSITTNKPNPMAWSNLTHTANFIYDSKAAKEALAHDPQWINTHEAGYGPYKLVEYTPGQQVVLEKFEDYWNAENAAWFDKVIIKEIPESSNRAAMLISGDLDAATNLTDAELKELEGKAGVKVLNYTGNRMTFVGFDFNIEPFKNPQVRKALMYATPYQEIINTVYLGNAQQLKSLVPSIYPGYTDEFWGYQTDINKARELLSEAGYPNGFEADIVIEANLPQQEQLAIMLQSSFREIGVALNIQKVQNGDFWSRVSNRKMGGMFVITDSPGSPDVALGVSLYGISDGIMNMGCYQNSEVDRLYQRMMETVDETERLALIKRIQKITVDEDPLWIFVCAPGYKLALRDDVMTPQWNAINEIGFNFMYRK